jgi:hypothetical protein
MNARILVVAVVTALAVSGCGGDSAASRVAKDFYVAVSEGDSTTACSLLAPQRGRNWSSRPARAVRKRCPPSWYGDGAIATRGGDTAFLARFADGWRVTAAGCTHIADDKPYECTVKGA